MVHVALVKGEDRYRNVSKALSIIQDVEVKFKSRSNYYEAQLWWMKYHPNYKW